MFKFLVSPEFEPSETSLLNITDWHSQCTSDCTVHFPKQTMQTWGEKSDWHFQCVHSFLCQVLCSSDAGNTSLEHFKYKTVLFAVFYCQAKPKSTPLNDQNTISTWSNIPDLFWLRELLLQVEIHAIGLIKARKFQLFNIKNYLTWVWYKLSNDTGEVVLSSPPVLGHRLG